MRHHPAMLVIVVLILAVAAAAIAGPRTFEFTPVQAVTDQQIADAKEPIKVGTMTHQKHGTLELWCSSRRAGGQYRCTIRKAGGQGEDLESAAAASIAAPYIPGGSVVANLMSSDDGRTGSSGTGSFLDDK